MCDSCVVFKQCKIKVWGADWQYVKNWMNCTVEELSTIYSFPLPQLSCLVKTAVCDLSNPSTEQTTFTLQRHVKSKKAVDWPAETDVQKSYWRGEFLEHWLCPLYSFIIQLQIRYHQTRESLYQNCSKNIHTGGTQSQNWATFSCSVKGLLFSQTLGLSVKRSRNSGSSFGSDPVTHMWICLQCYKPSE